MSKQSDDSAAEGVENAEVKTYTQAEVDAILAQNGVVPGNPEPAFEEGPHLDDPEIRRRKREQMQAHGWTGEEDHLTDDMTAILAEKGDD